MMNKNTELLNEANKLFLKKLFRDSLPIYDEILKSDPENIDVINNKGYALSKMKNYDEAILCYDKGLKINPTEKCLMVNNKNKTCKEIKAYLDSFFLDCFALFEALVRQRATARVGS